MLKLKKLLFVIIKFKEVYFMEIKNAKIKNVTVGLDDRDMLSARMTFESQLNCCDWRFILTDPIDSQRLMKLMSYTNVYEVNNLDGKIIRIVKEDSLFRGFGDPIEDKFVLAFGEKIKEVTKEQLNELLKTK